MTKEYASDLSVSLFWDTQPLTKLERLTLKSYMSHFDNINVFTYNSFIFDEWKHNPKINVYDARDIIPEVEKFYYKGNGDCLPRSVVGFSDIFRYKLLYEVGGWYSDFDVTCLKPYNFANQHTVIRHHRLHKSISNICKFQKHDSILLELYDRTKMLVNENNEIWCTPLSIFGEIINQYGYEQYIVKDIFGEDEYDTHIKPLLIDSISKIKLNNQHAIHWCRSAITTGNWSSHHLCDIENPFPGTYLSYLYTKYGL